MTNGHVLGARDDERAPQIACRGCTQRKSPPCPCCFCPRASCMWGRGVVLAAWPKVAGACSPCIKGTTRVLSLSSGRSYLLKLGQRDTGLKKKQLKLSTTALLVRWRGQIYISMS
eukprot:gene24694-biopygen22415